MQMKIAVFYHCRLNGSPQRETYWENRPTVIDPAYASTILNEQMLALKTSGLEDTADMIFIGVNGTIKNLRLTINLKTSFNAHGDVESLLPTMVGLQRWLPGHEDWFVLFFHSKGVTHLNDPLTSAWRRCMEHCVITKWRRCVADLENGFDTCGAHWISQEEHPEATGGKQYWGFWGGTFWWAKASFLKLLPPLPEKITKPQDWHIPELWIGSGPHPKVKDYAHHWPGETACRHTLLS